jgi:hypothetical protein
MTTYDTAEALLDLYQLRELPSPSEFGLVETQLGRGGDNDGDSRREPAIGDWRRIRGCDRIQASPAGAERNARDSRRSLT